MTQIWTALGWASIIILIGIASRLGWMGDEAGEWLMMAVLVLWASTSFPRRCGARSN